MPNSEFDIIRQYFLRETGHRTDVLTGIGDDAARIRIPQQHNLVCELVLLTEDTHFTREDDAYELAKRALHSACDKIRHRGVQPAWMTLSLQLPDADEEWLGKFSTGLFEIARLQDISLIGGDTTRGHRTINLQVCGYRPADAD